MDLNASPALHINEPSFGPTHWVQREPDSQTVVRGVRVSDGWDVERVKGQQAAQHDYPFIV